MRSPRLLLLLLGTRSRRRQERGFGLILALLTALVTVISAVTLINRTQGGLLGIAQQSESRMARAAAEAGLSLVIAELNRPANRRLLVSPVPFTSWGQRAASGDDTVLNPCLYPSDASQAHPAPSAALRAMADPANPDVLLDAPASPRGFERRFRLQSVRLSNRDRSRWYRSARPNVVERSNGNADAQYSEALINFDDAANTGLIELVVQGQVRRDGRTVASATLSRDFVVAPKCCNRSFGGPDQIFGNDFRWCNAGAGGFPPMVVGLANTGTNRNGGVYVSTSTTPEIRQRTDPDEPAARILCRLPREAGDASCGGRTEVNNVPVQTTTIEFPSLPKLGSSGLPCDANDATCLASTPPSDAYSIELFNRNNGASGNSATERYAKDYLRARNGTVEICNKTYTASGATAATIADFDRTPTIVAGSCVSLANYCARLDRNDFSTYHCRIRNIYANDFGATNDLNTKQNNTLFIDTSNGPIYLYLYDRWAKKTVSSTDPVLTQMRSFNYNLDNPPSNFSPIYTVGGYNDGQIQHVRCDEYSSASFACTDTSKAEREMSRAAILSDISDVATNSSDYTTLIGDDGFVRDVFFWMPSASLHIAGDPNITDLGGDAPQGKPQVSAGLWLNTIRFTRRTTELYLPSANDLFFPNLLDRRDRLRAVIHDWAARGSGVTSLFQILQ